MTLMQTRGTVTIRMQHLKVVKMVSGILFGNTKNDFNFKLNSIEHALYL